MRKTLALILAALMVLSMAPGVLATVKTNDGLTATRNATVSTIEDALNGPGMDLSYTNDTQNAWVPDSTTFTNRAVGATAIQGMGSTSSTISLTVDMAANEVFTFDWFISTEGAYSYSEVENTIGGSWFDYMTFKVNDAFVFKAKGNSDVVAPIDTMETYVFYPTEAGTYTFEWTYQKDVRDNGGLDALFLDNCMVITPGSPAAHISVVPATVEIQNLQTAQLTATILPVLADDLTVTWSSSDESIATVDANGLVLGIAPGTATITATSNSNPALTATSTVTVTSSDAANQELRNALNIEGGSLPFINDTNIPWVIDDTTYEGRVAAKSATQTISDTTTTISLNIEAKVGDQLIFDWFASTENANYDYLAFYANGVEIARIGGTDMTDFERYTYDILEDGLQSFAWTYSKDMSVSGGSDTGWLDEVEFTGVQDTGTSAIEEALNGPGMNFTYTNDSTNPWAPDNATFTNRNVGATAIQGMGDTSTTLSLTVDMDADEVFTFDWFISSEGTNGYSEVENEGYGYWDYVTFKINGVFAFKAKGNQDATAPIDTMETYTFSPTEAGTYTFEWTYIKDGYTDGGLDTFFLDNCMVTTPGAPATDISVIPTELQIQDSQAAQLTATVLPTTADDLTVTWSSSDESVATVDANGLVLGIAPGTAVITATSNSNPALTATSTVTVLSSEVANRELREALNVEGGSLPFINDMNIPWVIDDATYEGRVAAKSATQAMSATATTISLNIEATAGNQLMFDWFASTESASFDYLAFYVNGEEIARVGGTDMTDFERYTYDITEDGMYHFEWTFRKNDSVSGGLDTGWLDEVEFTGVQDTGTSPIAEALNGPGMNFTYTNDSTNPWVPDNATFTNRNVGATTTQGINNSQTTLSLTVELADNDIFIFDWFVSTEGTYAVTENESTIGWGWYDYVTFRVNGEFVFAAKGNNYANTLVPIDSMENYMFEPAEAGTYTFEWTYQKDNTASEGLDTFFLDNCWITQRGGSAVEISVTPTEVEITDIETAQLTATVLPATADDLTVTWTSSDESVATVDENGLVSGVGAGTAIITATSNSNPALQATSTVTVISLEAANQAFRDALNVEGGSLPFINAETYPWVIDDTTYEGRVVVKATNVNIDASASTISLTVDAEVGSQLMFDWYAYTEGSSWDYLAFYANGTEIARIGGAMSGFERYTYDIPEDGTYNFTWTYWKDSSGNEGSSEIVVLDEVELIGAQEALEGIVVDPTEVELDIGETATITVSPVPESATLSEITWTTSDETVATVENGVITGVSAGTATITATSAEGGFTDSCAVTVTSATWFYGVSTFGAGEGNWISFSDYDVTEILELAPAADHNIVALEYVNDVIYGYNNAGRYFTCTLDDLTPNFIGTAVNAIIIELAYDHATDKLYAIGTSTDSSPLTLYEINITSGEILDAIEISNVPATDSNPIKSFAISTDGAAYLADFMMGSLYSLNLETGAATLIGPTNLIAAGPMVWDHNSGTLYMTQLTGGISSVDPETLTSQSLGTIGGVVTELSAFIIPNDLVADIPDEEITIEFVDSFTDLSLGTYTMISGEQLPETAYPIPPDHTEDGYEFIEWSIEPGTALFADTTITAIYNKILTENDAVIILTAGDVWGDGTGYQMLFDADADTFGSIIPEGEPWLYSGGDAPESVYNHFEYSIPVNADGALATWNVVLNESVQIVIPAGTYDWVITNPSPVERILWIASDNGDIPGRYNNFEFEPGMIYHFTVIGGETSDEVILETSPIEFPEPTYTVTFYDWDGTVLDTQEVEEGSDATPPADPSREGHVFLGWEGNYTNVTSDESVYATYGLIGDANGDGIVNTGDAAYILRYVIDLVDMTPDRLLVSDVNNDNMVNTGDAAALLSLLMTTW